MVSGIVDRLHRLWTQPGQTLRGRVNHRTREPLLKNSQDLLQGLAESCLAVNIIVNIMKLRNCLLSVIKVGGPPPVSALAARRGLDDHVIAGYALRTASALEESGFYDRSGAVPCFGRGREHGEF